MSFEVLSPSEKNKLTGVRMRALEQSSTPAQQDLLQETNWQRELEEDAKRPQLTSSQYLLLIGRGTYHNIRTRPLESLALLMGLLSTVGSIYLLTSLPKPSARYQPNIYQIMNTAQHNFR